MRRSLERVARVALVALVVTGGLSACGERGATPPSGAASAEAAGASSPRKASSPAPGSSSSEAAAPAPATRAIDRVRAPDDAELASWLRAERLRAKADGRALVVFVSAGWCPPCKRVKAALGGGTDGYAGAPVRLVELDADADAARLGAAGYASAIVPALARVEAHGGPGARWEAPDDKTEAGIVAAWREALTRVAR